MNSYYIQLDCYDYHGESENENYNHLDYNKSGWQPKESSLPKIILKHQDLKSEKMLIHSELNLKHHLDYIFQLQKFKIIDIDQVKIIKK